MAGAPISDTQQLPSQSRASVRKSPSRSWWRSGVIAIAVLAVVATALAVIPRAGSPTAIDPALTHTIERAELLVTVIEQGTLESANNTEIKCKVRGDNTIIWVVEAGKEVAQGDELVRLETLLIEEEISERTKFAHLAKSAVARAQADVARAELAISEYLEGRYVSALATLQKDLAIAESKLLSTKNMLGYAQMMAKSEYTNELEVEEKEFAVLQADLAVKLKKTEIDVLQRFSKREELATLRGKLNAAKAKYEAERERAAADEKRLARAEDELAHCVVHAERSGIVIYPEGEAWKSAPEIEEGATVHKDQILLLMPDLSKMQVKVGIHESVIDRIEPGLSAKVSLPNKVFDGKIASVASVAKPAGWWSGNVVKYDTIVELPSTEGLKPGMSVEVEVIISRYENVLTVPMSAVLETREGHTCWVQIADRTERRTLTLGDSSDMFIVVESGLKEGDVVILDPLAHLEEAQFLAAELRESTRGNHKH